MLKGKTAKAGDQVSIRFIGRLEDNSVAFSTEESGPFFFTIGDSTIFKKISNSIVGMGIGETKHIKLTAREAFGEINPDLLVKVPTKQLPKKIEVGQILTYEEDQAEEWLIKDIKRGIATLDGNHPLAGKPMTFEVELLSVQDGEDSPADPKLFN